MTISNAIYFQLLRSQLFFFLTLKLAKRGKFGKNLRETEKKEFGMLTERKKKICKYQQAINLFIII